MFHKDIFVAVYVNSNIKGSGWKKNSDSGWETSQPGCISSIEINYYEIKRWLETKIELLYFFTIEETIKTWGWNCIAIIIWIISIEMNTLGK